ncbi:MAG: methylated-DNA--[protein]-cysteine S-methyltransferase [Chloroflexi bacterium]|nr:methylated-DNA--[protein]-cysteine S-methyltransferase [Chloroflexota bacterium]
MAAAEPVVYATRATALGRLLIAATPKGVCAIALGVDDEQLLAEWRREFPQAAIAQNNTQLREWLNVVARQIEGEQSDISLPLDIRATQFQQRVWDELRAIPRGETRSYTQIAKQIGRPSAVRAVASACASNRIAVAIPCHRVVRGSGDLSGYRWGVERKRALLERERGA